MSTAIMIERLLPHHIASFDCFDVGRRERALLPEERAAVAEANPGRVREFAGVRYCARRALADLGHDPARPIVPGPFGEPCWPLGLVGSMTHSARYAAAAVGWKREVQALGIDAERHAPLPSGVLNLVSSTAERRGMVSRFADGAVHWDRLLFSAKEAVFKAWFPLSRSWLDFKEIRVVAHVEQSFIAFVRPLDAAAALEYHFAGRWAVERGVLLTAVVAPPMP